MNRLGADKQLALFGYRVGLQAAELSDRENVPWSSRDPTTQALALIYGVMHIHKVRIAQAYHLRYLLLAPFNVLGVCLFLRETFAVDCS